MCFIGNILFAQENVSSLSKETEVRINNLSIKEEEKEEINKQIKKIYNISYIYNNDKQFQSFSKRKSLLNFLSKISNDSNVSNIKIVMIHYDYKHNRKKTYIEEDILENDKN